MTQTFLRTKQNLFLLKLLSLLILVGFLGVSKVKGQTTIAQQDFETSPATPTWTYTGGGAVNTTASRFNGASSYRFSGSQTLTMGNISISRYTNVVLSVAFAANGPDTDEDLFMDISYDDGVTWAGTGSIKLVDGFSNANISI